MKHVFTLTLFMTKNIIFVLIYTLFKTRDLFLPICLVWYTTITEQKGLNYPLVLN